jgi:hypothetical protein
MTQAAVTSVHQVVNSPLWSAHKLRQQTVSEAIASHSECPRANEVLLWHGTTEESGI